MKGNIGAKNIEKYVVIASALDWGLGHTTRCIPIFNELIGNGFHLIIAATDDQIKILRTEVPGATFYQLKGYNIHYNSKKYLFTYSILSQIPKIFKRILYENHWLKQFLHDYKKENVIIFSDNRPGFFQNGVYSIYLTHQTTIKTGNRLSGKIATAIHKMLIKNFNECWLPDTAEHLLSGALSTGGENQVKKSFIGPLSRFTCSNNLPLYDIAIILSGPEPQRSIFEDIILKQLGIVGKRIIFVRGLFKKIKTLPQFPDNIKVLDYLSGNELNSVLNSSELVICRSGYTSIMDLARIRAKAVLVPTPGQAEQEYLAAYLSEQQHFMTVKQNEFSLSKILVMKDNFPFKKIEIDFNQFKKFIQTLPKNSQ